MKPKKIVWLIFDDAKKQKLIIINVYKQKNSKCEQL